MFSSENASHLFQKVFKPTHEQMRVGTRTCLEARQVTEVTWRLGKRRGEIFNFILIIGNISVLLLLRKMGKKVEGSSTSHLTDPGPFQSMTLSDR